MWVDLLAASFAILADPAVISPGFLAYLMVIFGNGMRYGLRLFAEAVIGSLACALLVIGLRMFDYLDAVSVSAVFFLLFFVIIVLYSYSLTANIEKGRERLEAERDLDHLTGLLNRRALHERAERLLQSREHGREPLVVMFADLDRFKAVNDTHGHHVGDRVLTEIGRMLACAVRDTDLVARYGGDEFLLILRDTNLAEAGALAERLQQSLAEWSQSQDVDLSFSIGLGQYPDHGADLKTVIERVDQAMYRSKLERGRGGILQVNQAAPA
jgi:diguanylate cyclase (GGDEF)-like protein